MDYSPTEDRHLRNVSRISFTSAGASTSCSSALNARRDSTASSQSMSSYAHSFSPSYYSPRLPVTPISERSSTEDFQMVNVVDGQVCVGSPSPIDGRINDGLFHTGMHFKQLPSMKIETGPLEYDPSWEMVQQNANNPPVRTSQAQQNHLLPAAGDFGSALDAVVGQQPVDDHLQPSAEIGWEPAEQSVFPGQDMHYNTYDSNHTTYHHSMPYHWPVTSAFDPFKSGYAETTTGTITPSDAMLDTPSPSYANITSDDLENGFGSYNGYSSGELSTPQLQYPAIKHTRSLDSIRVQPDYDAYQDMRMIYMTPTGGKGVKKVRRASNVVKRKTKSNKLSRGYLDLDCGKLPVESEGDIERDSNGRYRRVNGSQQKKFGCDYIDEHGVQCDRRFQRQEHLKRHFDIHCPKAIYVCCVCEKRFPRKDNYYDHYPTHVTRNGVTREGDKGNRKPRFSLEHVYRLMDENLAPADIRKIKETIHKKLEKDRVKSYSAASA